MGAGVKGHQFATERPLETPLSSRWFLIRVVEFELFCGLSLLSGIDARFTWRAAIFCFPFFASTARARCVAFGWCFGCPKAGVQHSADFQVGPELRA
jgi:hypothetical protein